MKFFSRRDYQKSSLNSRTHFYNETCERNFIEQTLPYRKCCMRTREEKKRGKCNKGTEGYRTIRENDWIDLAFFQDSWGLVRSPIERMDPAGIWL